MPDLLLELFSEEIPARMQMQAAKDLERLVIGALSARGRKRSLGNTVEKHKMRGCK